MESPEQTFGDKLAVTHLGNSAPYNPTARELAGKIIVGTVVGFIMAFIVFLIIFMLGVDTFIANASGFLIFVLGLIAFLSTFVGNAMVMAAYHLFYGTVYYDFRKMFGFALLSTAIIFVLFVFVYLMGGTRDMAHNVTIFLILAFHILLNVFVVYNFIDFIPDPQYAASSFTGNVIGFVMVITIYLAFYKSTLGDSSDTQIHYLMILPGILSYSIIPLCQGLWQKFYYGMYEKGNNFFYIPTTREANYIDEINEEDDIIQDEVNVDV